MVENTLEQELNQITSIKSIKVFDNAIQQMVKLTDGKILLVSDSRIVKVLNPQNDYHEDFTGQLDTDSRTTCNNIFTKWSFCCFIYNRIN